MRVEARNGLIYDDTDSRCDFSMLRVTSQLTIAFIQCFDSSSGMVNRYCGVYDEYDKQATIAEIMVTGAKFDTTVTYWSDRI